MWLGHVWSAVWPNLLASALWGVPALWVHYRRLHAHHQRLYDELRRDLLGDEGAERPQPFGRPG